ncbi:MAG: efflux RND transporter permease subunit [Planctomycetota bacterium JB042]
MLNSLIRTALRNRLGVIVASLVVLVVGTEAARRLPIDVFPDLTAPTVTVLVEGHGMAPEEMETLVTFPVETALNGATGVRRIRSATAYGLAIVWAEFEWGVDVYRARQTVTERLSGVTSQLPEEVAAPVLAPMTSIMGEILFVALTSDRHDSLALRETADYVVRRRLLSVPGVAQVLPIGGDRRQFEVLLDPSRLAGYGITVEQVLVALEESNQNVSSGVSRRGGQEALILGRGRLRDVRDITETVVLSRGETPVRVRDLGSVGERPAFRRGTAAASRRTDDGTAVTEPAVIFAVQKQPGANTLELTARLDDVVLDLQRSLPEGMVLNARIFRQSDFIDAAIDNTISALEEGALFVIVVVMAFLLSIRASLITLVAIPVSLLVAVLTLSASGTGINTMTLGGMAIAIGALVDDAIIDVENVIRRLRENAARPPDARRPMVEVIFDASVEVRMSIVFATAIILLVFVPLFFLGGVEGRLLQPLGLAFTVSLAASLLVALTLTPALCSLLLTHSKTLSRREPRTVAWLKALYRAPLEFALRHPWLVTAPTVLLLAIATAGLALAGKSFLPEFNEGSLVVNLATVPGTSLEESDRLALRVQEELMTHPEVAAIGRRTGRAEEDEHALGVESSELEVRLDMEAPARRGRPTRSKAELLEALRDGVAGIPGIVTSFGQPISHRIDHMLSGTPSGIAVKIFGDDLSRLRGLAERARFVMAGIEGVVDLKVEQQAAVPALTVDFDRAALARHGLTVEHASRALAAASLGLPVTRVLRGSRSYDLMVRVGDDEPSARAIGNAFVEAENGARVPLKAVASIREDRSPNFIARERTQRKIGVTCNVAGRDIGSVVDDIRAAIEDRVDLPDGYHVEYGGQFESAASTRDRLLLVGTLVFALVGFLLHLAFRSSRDAVFVLLNLPLAMIGGVAGVWLSGGVLSVASIIGFITVFGIAARNGILLVAHIRHLQLEEGVTDFFEAVRRGALERLAPIAMTALSAGLALVPLALRGEDPGTEVLTPMAIVILFGLLSSTFLNMIVVPALYLALGRPVAAPSTEVPA